MGVGIELRQGWYHLGGCGLAWVLPTPQLQELVKFDDREKVEIFFSAHGVPKSYVEEAGQWGPGQAMEGAR